MPRVTKAEKIEIANAAADRLRKFGPTANLPVPGDPPPPLQQGGGEVELRMDPAGDGAHDVALDAAAFITLWRYCEAHALQLHNNPSPHARPAEEVYLRAVKAFRVASGQDLNPPPVNGKKWGGRVSEKSPLEQTVPPLRAVVKRDAARAVKVWGRTGKA